MGTDRLPAREPLPGRGQWARHVVPVPAVRLRRMAATAAQRGPQVPARARHRDRPVRVGAQHHRSPGPQRVHGPGRRVAICVVPADRDEGKTRTYGMDQTGMLMSRAVVRHLEHVDRRQDRVGPQKPPLGRWFEVTEQQHGRPSLNTDEQRDARVVGTVGQKSGACAGRGGAGPGRRPEHLPGQPTDPAPLPHHRAHQRYAGARYRSAYEGALLTWFVERGRLHHSHGSAAQHPGQPADVVRVEVGQQNERDPGDREIPQTAVNRHGIGPGVHHHGSAVTRGQHRRVALPHVAHRDVPRGRRPAGENPGERCRAHDCEQEQQDAHDDRPRMTCQSACQEDDQAGEGGEQQAAPPAARPVGACPGQIGPNAGHGRDPPGRPAGDLSQHLGDGHRDRGDGQGGEPEDRGRGDRELGEQIAGNRHQTHAGREDGDHRSAHGLCRGGGSQGFGEPRRHSSALESLAPTGSDDEQRSGRQDGEKEAVTPREPGVVQHQQEHGGRERGEERSTAPRADGEQGDGATGRRAQHARLRSAHHHEGERQGPADDRGPAERDAQPGCQTAAFGQQRPSRRPDQQDEHDGQVAAGHGEEMCEVRRLEGVLKLRCDPGGVSDDEPGEQRAGVGVQAVGRLAKPGPELTRRALKRCRRPDDFRSVRLTRSQHGREPVARMRRRHQAPRQPQPGRRQQPLP